jgi:H/ACA ribonucleoprotein complex subunit 4
LAAPGVVKLENFDKGNNVALVSLKGELVAMGEALVTSADTLKLKKGFIVKTHKVFMEPDTYPKGWRKENSENGE